MLRFFDFQVNLSTDQGRIKEIEVTARMTGNQEVIVETTITLARSGAGEAGLYQRLRKFPVSQSKGPWGKGFPCCAHGG